MQRLEVAFNSKKLDSTGLAVKADIEEDLGITGVEAVNYAEVYYFEPELDEGKLTELAEKAFIDPLIQKFTVNADCFENYDFYIEVKLHPDVTDNLGEVAEEALGDYFGGKSEAKVRSAKKYYFEGKLGEKERERIAKELLANEVIEKFEIGGKNE